MHLQISHHHDRMGMYLATQSDANIANKTIPMNTTLGLGLLTDIGFAVTVLTVIGTEPENIKTQFSDDINIYLGRCKGSRRYQLQDTESMLSLRQ